MTEEVDSIGFLFGIVKGTTITDATTEEHETESKAETRTDSYSKQ